MALAFRRRGWVGWQWILSRRHACFRTPFGWYRPSRTSVPVAFTAFMLDFVFCRSPAATAAAAAGEVCHLLRAGGRRITCLLHVVLKRGCCERATRLTKLKMILFGPVEGVLLPRCWHGGNHDIASVPCLRLGSFSNCGVLLVVFLDWICSGCEGSALIPCRTLRRRCRLVLVGSGIHEDCRDSATYNNVAPFPRVYSAGRDDRSGNVPWRRFPADAGPACYAMEVLWTASCGREHPHRISIGFTFYVLLELACDCVHVRLDQNKKPISLRPAGECLPRDRWPSGAASLAKASIRYEQRCRAVSTKRRRASFHGPPQSSAQEPKHNTQITFTIWSRLRPTRLH